MIWGLRIAARKDSFPQTLKNFLSNVLDPIDEKLTPAILEAYGIDHSVTSNTPQSTIPVLNFGNDITFALPAISYTRTFSVQTATDTKTFLYHFNPPNPWEGPWKGYATHGQDLMFVLQNYAEYLFPGQHHSAERFARDVITFINGTDPWPQFNGEKQAGSMIYYATIIGDKDESRYIADEVPTLTGRRNILTEVIKDPAVLDKLLSAWQMFMRGPE